MGRVGKTQTALAYVYSLKENYHSVFWISGVTQATLLSGFEQIRTETRCAIEASNPTETVKLVIKWLQEQSNWLLVIDNLDDISVIVGFLPSTTFNGHTVITTRNPNTEGIPAQGIEVEVLVSFRKAVTRSQRGFAAPHFYVGATYSGSIYQVGGAAVFLEPPVARLSQIHYRYDQPSKLINFLIQHVDRRSVQH